MESPSTVRLRVDAQGRMVIPRRFRDDLVSLPGELVARRTPEGVLLTGVPKHGDLDVAGDGLPLLRIGRAVSNDEVLDALDRERAGR